MQPIYLKYNRNRVKEFQIKTVISADDLGRKEVVKEPLNAQAVNHINRVYHNYLSFRARYPHASLAASTLRQNSLVVEYIEGETLEIKLVNALIKKDWQAFYDLLGSYRQYLESFVPAPGSDQVNGSSDSRLLDLFAVLNTGGELCMDMANIDINFDNIMVTERDQYCLIDCEWIVFQPIPIKYIAFRAVNSFCQKNQGYINDINLEAIYDFMEIDSTVLQQFETVERLFREYVEGPEDTNYEKQYFKRLTEFKNLVDKQELDRKELELQESNHRLAQREQELDHKNAVITEQEKVMAYREQEIEQKEEVIAYKNDVITQKDDIVRQKDQVIARQDQLYHEVVNSRSWKLTALLRTLGHLARRLYHKILPPAPPAAGESHNKLAGESSEQPAVRMVMTLDYRPLISVLVPVYNVEERWLRKCIESVLGQVYPHWQLCIADDASTEPHIRRVLEEYAAADQRIKVVYRENNGHISAASNSALALAEGEFIALLDHDDVLTADALYENILLINKYPAADMIYSDEDKIDEDEKRHTPLFKPDWSPDTLLSQMYTCHLGVYRTELVRRIGGFREGFEGAQDYDLVLRLSLETGAIYHIPKILYSWRLSETSTAANASSKPYAQDAGLKAINEYLDKRCGPGRARAEESEYQFVYNARYATKDNPRVSIIIPTRDQVDYLKPCVESILEKSTYANYEIIIMNNNSEQDKTFDWFKEIASDKIRVVEACYEFNWAQINNHGMEHATGAVYVFLNNDTVVISSDWLERLAESSLRREIGTVGALLLYGDDTIQHAGIVVGMNGWADHVFKGLQPVHYGSPFLSPLIIRNVLASTGACLAVSRDTVAEIGGFNEDFIQCGSDVEFSLRAYQKGLYNIYDPHVRLYHHESKTRDPRAIPDCDFQQSALFYRQFLERGDPFYNSNLDLNSVIPKEK